MGPRIDDPLIGVGRWRRRRPPPLSELRLQNSPLSELDAAKDIPANPTVLLLQEIPLAGHSLRRGVGSSDILLCPLPELVSSRNVIEKRVDKMVVAGRGIVRPTPPFVLLVREPDAPGSHRERPGRAVIAAGA